MVRHAKDNHHRKSRSMGGTNVSRNISRVPVHLHRAYHLLFANMLPQNVAKLLTETWIDPDVYLVAIPRKKSRKKIITTRRGKFCTITFQIEGDNLDYKILTNPKSVR